MDSLQRNAGVIGLIAVAAAIIAIVIGVAALAQSGGQEAAPAAAAPTAVPTATPQPQPTPQPWPTPLPTATPQPQPTPQTWPTPAPELPAKDNPGEYAVWLVDQAIRYYEENGLEAAIDFYSDPANVDGQWYVVIFDPEDNIVAHYNHDIIGEPLRGPVGTDVTGYNYGADMAEADEDGRWVTYVFRNPATGEQGLKHSWADRHDGRLFVSGWYEFASVLDEQEEVSKDNPGEYAVQLVNEAIRYYEENGLEAAIDFYSDPANVDGQWYIVIFDTDDNIIAHYNHDIIGEPLLGPVGTDVTGYNYGADMAEADEDGRWVTYVFRNPATGEQGLKHSWADRHDGRLFVSGWYEFASVLDEQEEVSKDNPGEYAVQLVNEAIRYYEENGLEAAIDFYSDPANVDGQWYVVIFDPEDNIVAHYNHDIIGEPLRGPVGTDVTGYNYGADMAEADEDGRWVTYVFRNPATGEQGLKHSWADRHDGRLFVSGWYEFASVLEEEEVSKSDPDSYTVWFVDQAIEYYEENGLEAAIDFYSDPANVDGQWYIVIFDTEDNIAAHYNHDIIGEPLRGPVGTDVTGYNFGADMAEADEDGRWVTYVFQNPATGEQGLKHSWADRHDGRLFVSGWYEFSSVLSDEPPTTDEPAEFTQAYVQQAIDMYVAEGREKTFEYYFSTESAVDRWYLFIIDAAADELVLHPNPDLLGAESATYRDPKGHLYGPELLKADEKGRWVDYYYRTYDGDTPVEEGDKHAWVQLHDGLIFASGWYENVTPLPTKQEDPAAYTQWFVQDAIDVYSAQGIDGLIERYSDPANVDGAWYVYVIGEDGTFLAHPTVPTLVGQNVMGRAGVDLAGNRFGPEFMEITEKGGWLNNYYFTNPESGNCENKHSWAVRRNEVIIGSGWYEPPQVSSLLPSKCEPIHFTTATVQRAIERYRAVGREATLAYHSSEKSVDDRWYTFIVDAETGVILAHPLPSFVGYDLMTGEEGYDSARGYLTDDLLLATPEGIVIPNYISVPTMDELNSFHTLEEVKHYYAVLEDGLIFTSGWYTAPPEKDDLPQYARLLVARSLTMYEEQGREATLEHYNSPESADGPWYVFILEDRDGDLYTIGHSTRPDLVGTTRVRIDADGYNYGDAFKAITEKGGGEWVSYKFTHPLTGEDAPKHTWMVRIGDLLFGAGWYEGIGQVN